MDGFITVNYGDYADPAALLATIVLPGGSQNYDNFSDPQLTSLLEQARGTADQDKRATLVAKAEELAATELPWIPDVQPTNITDHVQGPDRRDHLVRLHVRAVGQHAGRDRLTRCDLRFLGRRLAMLVASLLVASFVIFGALYLAPGQSDRGAVRRPGAAGGQRPRPRSALSPERAIPDAVLVLAERRGARQPRDLDHAAGERVHA